MRPFPVRILHPGESTICGRGKRRITSQRGKSCHGPLWERDTGVHTGQLYIRLVECHRPIRRGGCRLGSQGFVSALARSTSDRICKTRSTCLVETLVGNVARKRRNGALEIAGSEDCTLPIDFEYGQGAPGTVLEFTEHAAICVRATNVRA
jgi:hypothetical protein